MPKKDPIENALDRLGELRHAAESPSLVDELRGFLRNRSNMVVAKAAKVTRELRIAALQPDLLLAFNKFMGDAPRLDKRCAALTEIVEALYEFDYDDPAPFLSGLKHVQMEASFGPPVDAAAKLRAMSAQGLLRTRYPDAVTEVVPLLVDREPPARIGAVRALAGNGGEAGLLLLRLKALTGDTEAEVLGECFAGLLAASGDKAVALVAKFIDSEDGASAEAAILALGESRLPAAYNVLKEKWDRTIGKSEKKVLLVAMAASRLDEAIAFLVGLVESETAHTAGDALEALAIYKLNAGVSRAVQKAVSGRRERELLERFRRDFEPTG
jgi:hypothetical protein